MSSADDLADEAARWLEKAEEDLTAAARLLKPGAVAPLGPVCFHAQQCVEEYIKGLLVTQGRSFPKTHDITQLVALLPTTARPSLSDEAQDRLTDYATELRYPGEEEPITRGEARRAVAAARRVRKEIRRLLPKAALRRRRT